MVPHLKCQKVRGCYNDKFRSPHVQCSIFGNSLLSLLPKKLGATLGGLRSGSGDFSWPAREAVGPCTPSVAVLVASALGTLHPRPVI